jgi:8-oxo-dGTP pyrophosphatase MutT (NUDIX family)
LLFYPVDGETHVLLTERDGALPQHAGQVSLPGGAVEDDETIGSAALREAEEEVGLCRDGVRVLGCLSPLHIPVSAFILHPVIGAMDERPALRPRAGEVARILETPVVHLADPQRWALESRELRRSRYQIPYFDAQGAKLWGATAMVLAEFLEVAGFEPFSPLDAKIAQCLP